MDNKRVEDNTAAPNQQLDAAPSNINPFQDSIPPAPPSTLPPAPPAPVPRRLGWLKWAILAVILILATAAGLIFWPKAQPTQTKTLTKISVRLEWINNPEFTGMYVAKEKGYYQAAGLDVTLKEFENNTDVNKEVAEGQVDYGVSTPLEVILARDKGEDNKAIAAIYQTSAYSIAAQKSANINTPADFKGKILGNSGDNNEARVTYAALLANAGINPSDVTIKPVGFDITEVFKNNDAQTFDIYRTDQTYLLNQAHIAYTQVFPEQFGFAIYGDVLVASDKIIAGKPAQTKAFVQATMQGWQYAIDHQSEALTILAKYDNSLYKDPAYVKYDLENTLPLIRPTGSQPLGGMLYEPWGRAYQGVESAGLLKTSFDPTDAYTTRFVSQ